MRPRLLLTVGLALGAVSAAGQAPPEPLRHYLASELRASASELTALARGEVVTRLPDRRERREVAALGVVRIAATAATFVEAVLDVETTRRQFGATQVGRFSDPPRLDDVAALSLDDEDVGALRRCRVGDCDLKLSAAAIERVRTEVDWSARDRRAQANVVFRRVLVDVVSAYRREGNDALQDYADKPARLSLAADTRALVLESPFFAEHAHALIRALDTAPSALERPAAGVIYWSKEAHLGYKPVVSITHLVVQRPSGDGHAAFTASKQIYASHYFDASLALTAVLPSGAPDAPGIHVMYLNRSRVDALRGGWTGLKRAIAGRRVRRALETNLLQLKRRLETPGPVPSAEVATGWRRPERGRSVACRSEDAVTPAETTRTEAGGARPLE